MTKKFRKFCFTYNNPDKDGRGDGDTFLKEDLKEVYPGLEWAVCQLEIGKKGTPHLQGYYVLKNPVSLLRAKTRFRNWNVRVAHGSDQQNVEYCTKEEGRVDGPWWYPDEETCRAQASTSQGQRNDLRAMHAAIAEGKDLLGIIAEHPSSGIRYLRNLLTLDALYRRPTFRDGVSVAVFYGPSRSGKSYRASYKWRTGAEPIYRKQDNSKWWDHYRQEPTVWWDEFQHHKIDIEEFLQLTEGYPLQRQTKGAWVSLNYTRVVITSQESPVGWWQQHESYQAAQNRITLIVKFDIDQHGARSTMIEKGTQAEFDWFH